MGKFIDLVGQKFGRLTVIERVENNKHNQIQWLCQCKCNKQTVVDGHSLKSGNTKNGWTPEEAFGLNQEGEKVKFKTLDGKEISIQLRKKALCRQVTNRSKGQANLYILLKEIYGPIQIFEEFIIPGEKLSLDFFIPQMKIAFEFHGEQHYRINKFFHTDKKDFLKQKGRDNRKVEWCKINNITLVEISDKKITSEKLKAVIIAQIHKQSSC